MMCMLALIKDYRMKCRWFRIRLSVTNSWDITVRRNFSVVEVTSKQLSSTRMKNYRILTPNFSTCWLLKLFSSILQNRNFTHFFCFPCAPHLTFPFGCCRRWFSMREKKNVKNFTFKLEWRNLLIPVTKAKQIEWLSETFFMLNYFFS